MKYNLELDEEHLRVIQKALDMFFRGGMQQYDSMIEHALAGTEMELDRDLTQSIETCVKNCIRERFPEEATGRNQYYGITSDKIHDMYRVACFIHDNIRYRLAWDNAKDKDSSVSEGISRPSMQVSFDNPINWSENKDKIKIKRKE